ncbi:MAG: 50S ribosome-binding GTPase [Nanoarchaeota archaeon]|nr:50S ribosome-binding GTPase [Nanoarchaeota archaeon]
MRKRYSFSSRHTGQAKDPKNIRKEKAKFPAILQKLLYEADIIIQVLDARFIEETRNKDLEKYVEKSSKGMIYVINKSDLAEKIKEVPKPHAMVSCKNRKGIRVLRDKIKILASRIKKDKITVGIVGYPNTGKSSLINLLIGKKSAPSAPQPGYTKGVQKLKLSGNILLIDSPGVIPKEEYSSIEENLITKHTKVGSRSYSSVKNPEQIIASLMREFPNLLEEHYSIEAQGNSEILLEELGKRKNLLKKRGEVNFDSASRLILKDWQTGKIKV